MRRKDREIKDIDVIESIISRCDVCRVAFANNNMPYMVTMNFGYESGRPPSLYFHCATEGRKLEMAALNNLVCFEMDTDHELYRGEKACDWGMKFSSVVGYGRIEVVNKEEERQRGLGMIMNHYGGEGSYEYNKKVLANTLVLKIGISDMSAKVKS